jgi:glycosyltransferase involved in cell wall biosynthesis
MRIAIVNVTRGTISGGYQKYLERVVPLLRADERVTRLDVYMPRAAADTLSSEVSSIVPIGRDTWTRRELVRQIRERASNVVFIPTARWLRTGLPTVVMIRNAEPLLGLIPANGLGENTRNVARYIAARQAARKAHGVIAVSDYIHSVVVRRFGVDESKVRRIYHGLDSPSIGAQSKVPVRPHLLVAGSIRPARGLEDVLRAVALLTRAGRPKLVVAGSPDPQMHRYYHGLRRLTSQLGLIDDVEWRGNVERPELGQLMRDCAAFVMTSRAEACPNVLLEAMGAGCVIVSTTAAPMPEFLGDAGFYYGAGKFEELAATLDQVLSSSDKQVNQLAIRATERAMAFSWDQTSNDTVAFLESIVCSFGGTRIETCCETHDSHASKSSGTTGRM